MAIYQTHIVKPGDTLGRIASANGVTIGELVALNGLSSPDMISVGQILNIKRTSQSSYKVKRGDSLSAIAAHYGVTVEAIVRANGITNVNVISVDQVLTIPDATAGGAPALPMPKPAAAAGPVPQPGAASLRAAKIARDSVLPRSAGKCYRYVKRALLGGGAVDHYLGGASAIEAGPILIQQGFVDILNLSAAGIKSPYDAPLGAVIVYKATATATDRNRIHGHIEIRTADGFASDYFSPRARTLARENGLTLNAANGRSVAGVYVKPDKTPAAVAPPLPPVPPASAPSVASNDRYSAENLKLATVNGKYQGAIVEAGERTRMAPQTVAAIIDAEAAKVAGTEQWNANSKAGTSSASGLTQFLDGTWRGEAKRSGGLLNAEAKTMGLVNAANAVVDDQRLLALRFNPRISILAGADYAVANLAILRGAAVLPAALDPAGMAKLAYLAHHEGPGRAIKFLRGQMSYVSPAIFAANVTNPARRQELINAAGGDIGLAYRNWMAGYIDTKIDVKRFMHIVTGVTVPKLSAFFV